jgi:hypothetical protein
MSKYATELNRRITSGEPTHVTRQWYLESIVKAKGDIDWSDLTPEEREFSHRMIEAFAEWKMQQRQH